jgi:hypothetical protein
VSSPTGFQARDYSGIVDPVLLAGKRRQMTTNARSRAVTRLIAEFRERYEEIRAEEYEVMQREFARRLEATARKVARERGAA